MQEKTAVETWSENKKKWYAEARQLIIKFLGVSKVSYLGDNSTMLHFTFRIPFARESFKTLAKPFPIQFDYNNYFTGFQGAVELKGLKSAYLCPYQEDMKITFLENQQLPVEITYTFLGNELLDDLKQFRLEGLSFEEQEKALSNAVDYLKDQRETINTENTKALKAFFGRNTMELLIKGYLKHQYQNFVSLFHKALQYYNENAKKKEEEDQNGDVIYDYDDKYQRTKDEKYPVFPANFIDLLKFGCIDALLFQTSMEVFIQKDRKEIYQSEEVMKFVLLSWKEKPNTQWQFYFNNTANTEKPLRQILKTDFFYSEIISPIFSSKNADNQKILIYFLNRYPDVKDYLYSCKEKLNVEKLKTIPNGLYLHNMIFTPEFQYLPLHMVQHYGCSGEIRNVFDLEDGYFSSEVGEAENLTIIGKFPEGSACFITHLFLECFPKSMCTAPVITAIYFLPEQMPETSSIEKFFGMTLEKFEKGEFPQDEVLVPAGFIDLTVKGYDYAEFQLKEPMKGKMFICIFLKASRGDQNMDILNTGCLGYVGHKAFEKNMGMDLEGGGVQRLSRKRNPPQLKTKVVFL